MKTINAHQHQVIDRTYKGEIENAPMWLRAIVAPWYRRFLMWPLTIYLVVIGGLIASHNTEGWLGLLVGLPSFVLLLVIAQKAQLNWYEKIYQEYEDKHPVKEEKPASKEATRTRRS